MTKIEKRGKRKGGINCPVHKMWRPSGSGIALWGLLIFFSLLCAQAVVKDNPEFFTVLHQRAFQFKLMSAEAATTLLAGFVALMAARWQFRLSTKPVLGVTIGDDSKEEKELQDQPPTNWRATLRNRGSGSAVIKKISYYVRHKKTDGQIEEWEMNRDELQDCILAAGFAESTEFSLPRIVDESTLEAQGSTVLFAYKKAVFDTFWIEAQFEYAGILGDRYLKDLPCLARESPLNPANKKPDKAKTPPASDSPQTAKSPPMPEPVKPGA